MIRYLNLISEFYEKLLVQISFDVTCRRYGTKVALTTGDDFVPASTASSSRLKIRRQRTPLGTRAPGCAPEHMCDQETSVEGTLGGDRRPGFAKPVTKTSLSTCCRDGVIGETLPGSLTTTYGGITVRLMRKITLGPFYVRLRSQRRQRKHPFELRCIRVARWSGRI